ncbi:hypothetical protein BGW38_010626 [Lunasporangiospora selenospora]|uniref:ATP-binding cassette, subfamily B n=1 Tax=Lunasporangiospora selenospora TaxID=979761 RepID=A0A9P6FWP8_9FUNG|nr:hypothetical protein BGW38_010626 [Lunasporangiospora selenospora]
MSSWCGNEPWGPYSNDTLDFTPCFREVALETVIPLSFIVLTLTICGARPLLAQCVPACPQDTGEASPLEIQQQDIDNQHYHRSTNTNGPPKHHNHLPHVMNGYSHSYGTSPHNISTTNNNHINTIASGGAGPLAGATHGNINTRSSGGYIHSASRAKKITSIDSDPLEDAGLLLEPKAYPDRDPRPESFVNHPTTSDIVVILLSMIQALLFLALVIVRWRFLELGGRHGQPGHIHLPAYRFTMPVAQAIAWSYACVLCILAAFTRHIVRPSRIRRMLIVYALFTMVNALLRLRTSYRCFHNDEADLPPEEITPEMHRRLMAEYALSIVNAAVVSIFSFVILTTARGPQIEFEKRPVSSEANASFFRWISYNWMNDLMWEGSEHPLELEDLPSLTDQMRARPMYRIFARTREYVHGKLQSSLLWRIYITNKRDLWINFAFGAISSITSFGVPYFLQKLLVYIEDPEKQGPQELAYLYVFGMLVSDMIKSITFGQNLYYGRRMDIRLRAMLSAEVYAKALRRKDMTGIISSASTAQGSRRGMRSDTGMITNLMAVDANRVSSLTSSLFFLYTCPFEIIIATVMLYNVLGLSAFVGIGVMLLTFPAHHFAAKKYAKIQEQLMETRDRRVRDQELRRFVRLYIINTIFTLLWFGSPILMTVMSFTSYTKLEHQTLTSSVAFTSMAIFILLTGPMNVIPSMAIEVLEALVSVKRIEAFLNEDEIWKYTAGTGVAGSPEVPRDAGSAPHPSDPNGFMAANTASNINGHVGVNGAGSNVQSPSMGLQTPMQGSGSNALALNTIGFTNATFQWHTKVGQRKASSGRGNEHAATQARRFAGTTYGAIPSTPAAASASRSCSNNSSAFMLNDITLNFPVGKLSLVCGATGSGKTSLLMALLREMDLISGQVNMPLPTTKILDPTTGYIPNTIAYVSQYPWLQQASIRENILFGSRFEAERYKHVLEACALIPDLAVFEHGDLTEIGEKGITLSGGQKQRVALARAVYSRAQHILFDDCLSAVDAHTARHMFEKCLMGPIVHGRTRILVTHHVRLCLRDATYVALLKDGNLALSGSPVKLIRSGLLSEILERNNGMTENEQDTSSSSTLGVGMNGLGGGMGFNGVNGDPALAASQGGLARVPASKDPSTRTPVGSPKLRTNSKEAKRLVEEEARSKGKVKMLVYNIYMKACGGSGFWLILVFMVLGVRLLDILEIVWLKIWSSAYPSIKSASTLATAAAGMATTQGPVSIPKILFSLSAGGGASVFRPWNSSGPEGDGGDEDTEPMDLDYYIGIYSLIAMMAVFLTIVRMFWQLYGSLRASRSLYEELLASIVRAPIRFFDTTPVGRLINRFSKDFEVIDGQMMPKMALMLINISGVLGIILLISLVTPGFLIAAAFIALAYCFVGAYYISSSRELKRIESVTKSPLYSHFGETLVGVSTIRAFGVESRFMEDVLVKLDNNNAPYYFLWMCNRWLNIRVDFIGAMVSFTAGILILRNLEDLDAGWAGLSLGSAMNFMGLIYWLVRIYTEMEMSLNSVERVHEYLQLPKEPPAIIEGSRPPAGWPYDGTINIQGLTMQYAPDLGPVLHNITINIRPREKIGIVGRTGSGKSTLALSLFRFMEPMSGSIIIDGIDISKIGLEDLRRSLTIIPQDAVLFNGTIRSNLDPFQEHADHEIWEALRRVHLVKARGSRSGSASSSTMSLGGRVYYPTQSQENELLYQHHPSIHHHMPNHHEDSHLPHPHSHHDQGHGDSQSQYLHPHLHHTHPYGAMADPQGALAAVDYGSQLADDPFHPPTLLSPVNGGSRSPVLSQDHVETMSTRTTTTASMVSPLLVTAEPTVSTPLLAHTINNTMNGFHPHDPTALGAASLLCSPLNPQNCERNSSINGGLRPCSNNGNYSASPMGSPVLAPEQVDPFESLDSPVSDGGHNFSQGQRQLLCMARALLRQSKVIIMDEATASVDLATDEKIQTTIRNELGDSTLITVAHRLRTIMDYDRVLVLELGRVVEFDSPINLITNHSSRFRDMVEKSGECETLFEMAYRAY